jgi:hypothetical protein
LEDYLEDFDTLDVFNDWFCDLLEDFDTRDVFNDWFDDL